MRELFDFISFAFKALFYCAVFFGILAVVLTFILIVASVIFGIDISQITSVLQQ